MRVKELKALLTRAEAFLAASGAKSATDGIRQVRDMLDGDQHKTVDAFVDETRAVLPEQVDGLSAKQIAEWLERIDADETAFGRLFAGLQAKGVQKEILIEAASLYVGGKPRWRTKPAALKAIRASFDDRAYQASKMVFVNKSTPW